jgi:hypothetical protein
MATALLFVERYTTIFERRARARPREDVSLAPEST